MLSVTVVDEEGAGISTEKVADRIQTAFAGESNAVDGSVLRSRAKRGVRFASAAFCSALATATPSLAQIAPPPALTVQDTPRVRLGGLAVNPLVSIRNVGVDGNVFNTTDAPQRDFTATLSPGADLWLRVGRLRARASGRGDFIYFKTFSSERSLDRGVAARFEVPLNRLMPWAEVGSFAGRQRLGSEIDVRSRRSQHDLGTGIHVRLASKTMVELSARRNALGWDGNAVFLGTSLRDALARTSTSFGVAYRQDLTPLTTVLLEVTSTADRFDSSQYRDTDNVSIMTGFELKPRALVTGSARVGYKKVDVLSGSFASFRGVTANVSTGFVVAGVNRVDVEVARDVAYSFEPLYPYYVVTTTGATVTRRLSGSWDLQANLTLQRLAYTELALFSQALSNRTDRLSSRRAGVGYYLNRSTRLALNLDHVSRSSPMLTRRYNNFRVFSSVTYAQANPGR